MKGDSLHDERQLGFFWVHDDLFDKYAPEIGVYGVAVYCLLARMANGKGVSWPSYSYVAKRLKISRRTAMRAVETLVEVGLVEVEEQYEPTPDGHTVNKSNRYTLKNIRQGGASESPPSASESPRVVQESHGGGDSQSPKGIHIEGIHNKGRGDATKNGKLSYLDRETHQIVHTLMSIEKWDKNEAQTLEMVSVSKTAFPKVDLAHVVTSLSYKIRTGAVQYKKPSRAFPNWVAGAAERGAERVASQEPPRIRSREI